MIQTRSATLSAAVFVTVLFAFGMVEAQSQVKSPVFRDYQKSGNVYWAPSRLPGIGKQIYQFELIRRANNGEAEAQNDIGLRYLLGDGFEADTAVAVMWIKKAAAQNLYAAHYNMGLLYNIGVGLEWNPYKGYLHLRYAANNDEPNAQYAFALLFTDGLAVERNWQTAYRYLKRASMNGVHKADEVIEEILAKGYISAADTTETVAAQPEQPERTETAITDKEESHWAPVFLDFDRDTADIAVPLQTLLIEALETAPTEDDDSLRLAEWLNGGVPPDSAIQRMFEASDAGNPEATVFLGRAAETGLLPGRGQLWAAQQYIHGIYIDSWRAGMLLQQSLRTNDISKTLTRKSFENDSIAMFVWAGLRLLNMDMRLEDRQALELMTMAAEGGNITAQVHLGMCYASGMWTERDMEKAVAIWQEAAQCGSIEAESRIAAEVLLEGRRPGYSGAFRTLEKAREMGSLLAVVAEAYAYQSGTGHLQNMTEALRLYRSAAVRGSRNAHKALLELYRERRPDNWEELVEKRSVPEVR